MTHIYYIHFLHGNLWTEAFSGISNPVALLIAGDKKKSIYWNDAFCHDLAKGNEAVGRFDHRDTRIYTHSNVHLILCGLLNLARDVLRIIYFYRKSKTHFIGSGLGEYGTHIIALFIPEKVLTLVLSTTTCDARSIEHKRFDVNGKEITPLWFMQSQVSRVARIASHNPHWVPNTIQKLRLTNGAAPFDQTEGLCHDSHTFAKTDGNRVISSNKGAQITLIVHKYADLIIQVQHACSMKHHSPHAKRSVVKGLGHL